MTIEEDYDLSETIDRVIRLADGLEDLSVGGLPTDYEFTQAAKWSSKTLKGVSAFLQAVRRTESELEALKVKLAELENKKVTIL